MEIRLYEDRWRDDMIFMVLSAKDALGRVPAINSDLLDIKGAYFGRGDSFWVALGDDGRVIGCIGYSRTDGTTEAFLHRLFVKPSEKRRGIGTQLLLTVEAEMKRRGITVSKVHMGSPKEQWFESYAFYPKHGYEEYEPGYMRKTL